jgi:hypothetical protein
MGYSKVIEKRQRLSISMLWALQNSAYCKYGPHAKTHKGTPFYAPSYPITVVQDCHIVANFLCECYDPDSQIPLDLSQPIYILDLAPGTGRFGFLFMKMLLDELRAPGYRDIQFCYVMTDISKKSLQTLMNHPYLQPYVKLGLIDFAHYNYAKQKDKPITLLKSKKVLSKEYLRNPLVVIGNYFFESIPQDLFRVKKGKLQEGRVSIAVHGKEGLTKLEEGRNIVPFIRCKYSYAPIENPNNYYANPELDSFLKAYSQQFNNFPFLFPIKAFQVIEYFANLSQGRMLFLAGNQDVCSGNQTAEWEDTKTSKKGDFTLAVNYHAIAKYFLTKKGMGLLNGFYNPQFAVIVGILGGTHSHYPTTFDALISHDSTFKSDYLNILHYNEFEWAAPRKSG